MTMPYVLDPLCSEPGCGKPYCALGLCKGHYKKAHGAHWKTGNPEARKARDRAKTHKRRYATRTSDVTTTYEQELRAKAKRCQLCRVSLVAEPYLAASKELDHMVPLGVGGTHTIGNVRIICRACNLARPKDGSDYSGPVTLWAVDPGFVIPSPRRAKTVRLLKGPQTCQCGKRMQHGICYGCNPTHPMRPPTYIPADRFTPEQQVERAHTAKRMRAQGTSWWIVADTLGYGRESSALLAIRRYAQ